MVPANALGFNALYAYHQENSVKNLAEKALKNPLDWFSREILLLTKLCVADDI